MPYLEQAKKVHEQELTDELEGPWSFLGGKFNHSKYRVTYPGGSWIQWVSAERADAARGIRCDVVSVDECDDVDPEVQDAIVAPWFSEPHSLAIEILSGTPRRGRHGLLWRTHARAHGIDVERFPRHHSFHATCRDFPAHMRAQAVEDASRGSPEIFKREWLCDFDAAEGLVYGEFRTDAGRGFSHVREPDRDQVFSEFLIGGDHGFEHPGVLLVIGIAGHGADATAHVLEEVYQQHREPRWWTDQVASLAGRYSGARWFFDPSRPDLIRSYQQAGARIGEVDNAIEDGVGVVQSLLHVRERGDHEAYAQLYVSPRCTNLIREFGLYRRKRDPRNRERVLEAIEDKNNHAMDALRYPLFARFRATTSSRRSYRET